MTVGVVAAGAPKLNADFGCSADVDADIGVAKVEGAADAFPNNGVKADTAGAFACSPFALDNSFKTAGLGAPKLNDVPNVLPMG